MMFIDHRNNKFINNQMNEGVMSSSFINQYLRVNEILGIRREKILEETGVTEQDLNPPNGWVPQSIIEHLFTTCLKLQPDSVYGIRCATALEPSMAGVVGFIALSCPSLLDLHRTLRDFGQLITNLFKTELKHQPGLSLWLIDFFYRDAMVNRHSAEWVLAGSAMLIQRLDPKALLEVHFNHAPALLDAHTHPIYAETFKCPVKFEQSQAALVLDPQYLNKISPNGDPIVYTALCNQAKLMLEQSHPQNNIIDRVRQEIHRLLVLGHVSRDLLCKQMGISSRHLHRQLQLHGSSYQMILDDIRIEVVQNLMNQYNNLDSVSAALGFSSVKSFSRWFDNKMGISPSEFKRKRQLNSIELKTIQDKM